MTAAYLTRCDDCGLTGRVPLSARCPFCEATGGDLSDAAEEMLVDQGRSRLERVNARRGQPIRTKTLGAPVMRVIPARRARTRKARAATSAKGETTMHEVVALTRQGYSAAQIAVRLHLSPNHVTRVRRKARERRMLPPKK